MKLSNKARLNHIILIAACVAIVATSALDTLFHFPGLNILSEKRDLEKLPDIQSLSPHGIAGRSASLSGNLQLFVSDVVKYYDDNFGLRSVLVFLNNAIKVLVFNSSPTGTVVIGKSGWLYFAGDRNLDYYQNNKNFTPEELAHWNYAFEAKRRWLAKMGIYYLLIIAPNKSTIYPEYLPDSIRKKGDSSLKDQLLQSMTPEMREHVLELRETLWAAKKERLVYSRTDTHWNQEGAYLVYGEIIKKLNKRFPEMRPQARSDFDIFDLKAEGGDLAAMLSLSKIITEDSRLFYAKSPGQARPVDIEYAVSEAWKPSVFEINDDSLPRAVIMHDSFGNHLKQFLTPHFKRTVYLWRSGIQFSVHFETHEIEQEKPDIVIEEFAERKLYRFMPYIPEEMLMK